jgi:hypothetical protein
MVTSSTLDSSSILPSSTIEPSSTPEPIPTLCADAPEGLQHHECEQITKACECLSLATPTTTVVVSSTATETVISTSTAFTETVVTTTTTTTQEIAATETETETPTTTVVETATATFGPDLKNDPNNCGACGNVCPSGACNGGMCTNPGCAASSCNNFVPCNSGAGCVCGQLSGGGGLCLPGRTPCSSPYCDVHSDCGPNQLCVVKSCCRGGVGGICVNALSTCTNEDAPRMLFVRRPAVGDTVIG